MKVLILTEGGKDKGFGHITRCVSLYQSFEKKGIKPEFIINGDDSIRGLLKNIRYKRCDWLEERQDLFDIARKFDAVIIDSYFADLKFYKEISSAVKIPVYLDDNKRIPYPRGIVINGNVYAKEINYPERKDIIYLLGSEYALIRKEFWEVPLKKISKKIKNFLLISGGNDRNNIMPKVLKLMINNYPEINKSIIIGKGFENLKEIRCLKDSKTELKYSPSAQYIRKYMFKSDIAISGGGQILNELARIGVPAIVIALADDQLNNIKGWRKRKFIEYAGEWNDKRLFQNIERSVKKLVDLKAREDRYIRGINIVDGKGSFRAVNFLLGAG